MGRVALRGVRAVVACTMAAVSLAACLGPRARVTAQPQTEADVEGGAVTTTTPEPVSFLPDLIALPPKELYMRISPATGGRELRFSTTIVNLGDGPLDLVGRYDRRTGKTIATQRIETVKDTVERIVGSFVYHSEHEHWHFEAFTMFELWSLRRDGSLGSVVATTGKMTFCIRDAGPANLRLPGAPAKKVYDDCEQGGVQGISVGWGDTYRAKTPGQSLDLRGVPDGRYAIRSTSDPENRLAERNESNNATTGYVRIDGMNVRSIRVLPA